MKLTARTYSGADARDLHNPRPHQFQSRGAIHTNTSLNDIERSSPYRAVNTLRLSYTNQSVNAVYGNNRCLFSDPHKTHKYSLCGQNVELLNVKLVVHIMTTGLIIGKFTLAVP